MAYTKRLVRRFGQGVSRVWSAEETMDFVAWMRIATEDQRKADERARAESERRARDKWLGGK